MLMSLGMMVGVWEVPLASPAARAELMEPTPLQAEKAEQIVSALNFELYGRSDAPGIYSNGSLPVIFNLFQTSFVLNNPTPFGSPNWLSQDRIAAVSAQVISTVGNATHLDLIRIVTKWGTPEATFSVPNNVSFSGGRAGVGGIQLGTFGGDLNPNQPGFLAPNVLHRPTQNLRYDGQGTPAIGNDFGRLMYQSDGVQLTGFQVLLNTSYVARVFGLPAPPELGSVVLNLQRGGGSRIEALIFRPFGDDSSVDPVPNDGAVPEPGSIVLASLALVAAGVWRVYRPSQRQPIR
jgi:hypothetical protein